MENDKQAVELKAPLPYSQVLLTDKADALQSPDAYPHAVRNVECIETHFAWVFLAGEYAYKLRKDVRSIDPMTVETQSTALRRHLCERELHLNRRLAPDVYLEVTPLAMNSNNQLRVNGEGEAVDWLIKMQRLHRASFLDSNWRSSLINAATLQKLILLLTNFYRRQSSQQWDEAFYCNRLLEQVTANARDLAATDLGLPVKLVRAITRQQQEFIRDGTQLLGRRAVSGRIIEVHGDLRPEHIYLGTPMCVIDCLEFDRNLRTMDPIEELAFLLVECSVAGAAWVGAELIMAYQRVCNDHVPDMLVDFYASHRAATRARIVAWHLRDPQFRHRLDWRALATNYLHLALSYLD